jgi:hypothetical protein
MNQKSLLLEGIADAVGFLGGALLGLWIGRMFGLDIFAAGYGNKVLGAILLVGLGGGLGLKVARLWTLRRKAGDEAGS